MKCAKCDNHIGRAQVICDGCGVLLTEESSRIETRTIAPATESQKTPQEPSAQVQEPVEHFEPGQDLSPEQVMAALGAEAIPESSGPAKKSSGIQISKEQIAEALASKEPLASTPAPASQELPPTASLDYLDATPSSAETPVLPEIEIPETASFSTPTLGSESEIKSAPQEELKSEGENRSSDPSVTDASLDTPKTSMKTNIIIWAIIVFFPLLAIISWILCWKSSWPKKHKVFFIVGTALYLGAIILISVLPFVLVMFFADPSA